MTRYNPNPAHPLYSLYTMYAELSGYLDLKLHRSHCKRTRLRFCTTQNETHHDMYHYIYNFVESFFDIGIFLAATAGLANGLGLLLEQLRVLEAAQRSRFSPEQFLKLAANGNDKLVSQMVKGEPDLVNTLNYFCSD